MVNDLPDIELNMDNNSHTNKTLNNTATKEVNKLSPKNCTTNCLFDEPVTLRMPISFALRADLAVVRFI